MFRWLPALWILVAASIPGLLHASEPTRRALLIGINEYASEQIIDLRGARNDIALIEQTLVEELGFENTNIATLVDEEATRQGVLDAIEAAVTATQAGDFLYLHYSGHGSRVDDASGDELDGLDETIIPHNARTPGVPDILDDELDDLLARLSGSSLVVFDSCHSGTITRSASGVMPRSIPPDTRTHLYARPQTRAMIDVPELRHVLMTSAADSEEALDGPIDGVYYGFFSYALAQAMRDGTARTSTPESLHKRAQVTLAKIHKNLTFYRAPEPQLESPPDLIHTPMFSVDGGPASLASAVPSLTALTNPSAGMRLTLELAGPYGCDSQPQVRGIRTIKPANGPNIRRIRHPSDPRTFENTLQLRLTSTTNALVSVVYIDSTENASLIFPEQSFGYLTDGQLVANVETCLPDSLRPNNEAGFYWDFGAPAGTDTIVAIATTDAHTAIQVRDLLRTTDELSDKVANLKSVLTNATDWDTAAIQVQLMP